MEDKSYIQSEEYLINYIPKVVQDINLDVDKLLPKQFYIELVNPPKFGEKIKCTTVAVENSSEKFPDLEDYQ